MDNTSRDSSSDHHLNQNPATSILPTSANDSIPLTSSSRRSGQPEWATIDGPLGLSHEDSLTYARRFFKLGFLCLPFLWALNCFYFWPVLRHPQSHHAHSHLRQYLFGSAIGFLLFATVLSAWALTFAIGGEHLFGHIWDDLVMYNLADKYGLTGWI